MQSTPDPSELPASDQWLFVIVMNPGNMPQIAGQHDDTADVSFIPSYVTREDAQQGLLHLTLSKSERYEIQAFIYEDLCEHALAGGFLIYLIDGDGTIKRKIAP
jgi:hypothetical protein